MVMPHWSRCNSMMVS